jgi:hypothetical protein
VCEGGLAYAGAISMSVPEGVTWTSESGAFLMPETSTTLDGVAMLLALGARRRAG